MRRGRLSTSYRRQMLDRDLAEIGGSLCGVVLDLGGEWLHRRGTFRPPRRADLTWMCINVDPAVAPDVIADVACVPLADACADAVVCTEILEHVSSPETVIAEAHRLIRPDGMLIISVPFLYPVHADPYDFRRLTAVSLETMLRVAGFTDVSILTQGLYFTVLMDMIRAGLARMRPGVLRWPLAAVFLPLARLLVRLETRWASSSFISSFPAGYFGTALKDENGAC